MKWLYEILTRMVFWLANIHDDPDRNWVLMRDPDGHPYLVEEYRIEEKDR